MWLKILSTALEKELKVLDFAYWLNYYYLVWVFFFFFFVFLPYLGPHPQHIEVLRLGVELEL